MILIVLAAGFATRMWPLTKNRAKPLLDIAGRTVLDRLLDVALRVPGIESIHVVTNARFREDFERWANERDDLELPLRVIANDAQSAEELRGALADLSLALDSIDAPVREAEQDGYLILAGDNLIEFELAPHVERFRSDGRSPTLLVRRIPGEVPPARYGEVLVDDNGRITRFREKPQVPESDIAATGLYVMPPEVPQRLRSYLDDGGNVDAPGHFVAWLVDHDTPRAQEIEGKLWDIGNLETLELARRAYAES